MAQRRHQRKPPGRQLTRPHGARAIEVLPTHHRSALRALGLVVVPGHFRVLPEHRPAGPVLPSTLQGTPARRVQRRTGPLRFGLLGHLVHGGTHVAVALLEPCPVFPHGQPLARDCCSGPDHANSMKSRR